MVARRTTDSARYVVITGLSGSGKSTALKALEDLEFYAVDNLPVELLSSFVNLPTRYLGGEFKAALGIDMRSPHFLEVFPAAFTTMLRQGMDVELLFLEASDEILLRRYSQTRRQHPLASQQGSLSAGIRQERELLLPIRELAHMVIDTSRFTLHDLRQEIIVLFSGEGGPAELQINLLTFGFKHGLPKEADLVMDVRFLENPYFVEELRDLDGRDSRVRNYVFKNGEAEDFLEKFKALLEFLIPRYREEGKSQLTIAMGCTGGKHRSVATAEWLATRLTMPGTRLTLRHRDLGLD